MSMILGRLLEGESFNSFFNSEEIDFLIFEFPGIMMIGRSAPV